MNSFNLHLPVLRQVKDKKGLFIQADIVQVAVVDHPL